jgi:hypothetical protein
MPTMTPVAVPASVPTGTSYLIGARRFTARTTRSGERLWIGRDARFLDVVLTKTDSSQYAVVPWLEEAGPRAMRELIRMGVLVPADPFVLLESPTEAANADDAALRVAVIEGLLETAQVTPDDAWQALRVWRALRDGAGRT